MIMLLDYEFELENKTYKKTGVDIGETCDIEAEKKDIEGYKKSAICHEFDLTYGYDDDKIDEMYKKAKFNFCDLYGLD